MAIQTKKYFKLNEKNIFPPFPLFQSQILKVSMLQDTTIQSKLKGDRLSKVSTAEFAVQPHSQK